MSRDRFCVAGAEWGWAVESLKHVVNICVRPVSEGDLTSQESRQNTRERMDVEYSTGTTYPAVGPQTQPEDASW